MPGTSINESASQKLAQLLHRVARRDQVAFAELYILTKSKLFSIAMAIVKRRDIAEEILQEAYVKVWTNAISFDPLKGSPMTWMITIVRNLSISVVRRPCAETFYQESDFINLSSSSVLPLEEIISYQDIAEAMRALKNLDPEKRRLIAAAYIHGESRAVLSQKLGVPVSTIKTWLRRGLLEMRSAIEIVENEFNRVEPDARQREGISAVVTDQSRSSSARPQGD